MAAILDEAVTAPAQPETVRLVAVPEISVIMPAFNEEAHIAGCIRRAQAYLEGVLRSYEIIVVDDGSTDATRREAEKVGGNPHVKVVGYPRNQGKGFAVKYGAEHVSGDLVVFMDSDADIQPDLIERYITILKKNDIAIASKRHPDSRVSAPILRKFLSYAFHILVMILTGVRVSDTQSGFKAFRRETLTETMNLISVKRYAFDVEVFVVAKLLKLRIAEMPVKIQLGSLFSARHVLRMLVDLMGITYRLRVIHWYQRNLHNSRARYSPIIKW